METAKEAGREQAGQLGLEPAVVVAVDALEALHLAAVLPQAFPVLLLQFLVQLLRLLEEFRREPVRNQLMLALAYDAALRREELCKLKVKDARHARKAVPHLKVSGKGGKTRIVPAGESAIASLARYAERGAVVGQRDDEPVEFLRLELLAKGFEAIGVTGHGLSSVRFPS